MQEEVDMLRDIAKESMDGSVDHLQKDFIGAIHEILNRFSDVIR